MTLSDNTARQNLKKTGKNNTTNLLAELSINSTLKYKVKQKEHNNRGLYLPLSV